MSCSLAEFNLARTKRKEARTEKKDFSELKTYESVVFKCWNHK